MIADMRGFELVGPCTHSEEKKTLKGGGGRGVIGGDVVKAHRQ